MTNEEKWKKEHKKWLAEPGNELLMQSFPETISMLSYLQACRKRQKEFDMLLHFLPDGWQMPLGWNELIAQIKDAK